jgi:hypothetical protein
LPAPVLILSPRNFFDFSDGQAGEGLNFLKKILFLGACTFDSLTQRTEKPFDRLLLLRFTWALL